MGNNELFRSLGMTLIHSLWEGLVIMALVFFTLSIAGKTHARLRYAIHVSGLMLLLTGFFTTWYILYHRTVSYLPGTAYAKMIYSYVPVVANISYWSINTTHLASSIKHFLEPFYPSLAVGWILGFVFMVIRMTGGFYYSYRSIRKELIRPEASLLTLFENARIKLQIRAKLSFRLTYRKISPMVIGIIKPCVIIPVAILSGLNTLQIEAILVHELAHIRRYDHLVLILQAIASEILFFHPVAWFLSAGINRERENCCDDIVMKIFPNPINYIKALTMIQELNVTGPVPANALLGKSKSLLGRIKRLLKTETKHAPAFRLAAVFLLLITLGIAVFAITNTVNHDNKMILSGLFPGKTEKAQVIQDTIRNKSGRQEFGKKESGNRDNAKKKKEMDEARGKLEKAQQELLKAQQELERAREEVQRAWENMRGQDLASMNSDIVRAMNEARMDKFRAEHNQDLQQQMKIVHENMARIQEKMQSQMQNLKPEDWQRFKEEWQKSGAEMKKAMEDFYRTHKDSGMFMFGPHPFVVPPVPPCPPMPVPPAPNVDIPDMPEMDVISPEQEEQLELLQPDEDNLERADSLDSN